MNIVVFYLIYDILKRENKLQEERIYRIQVKNQIGMYRSISENFDKQKKMTHEYKNQIMCIDSLIKKKKYDSLESFVNKISGQISKELDFICTNNVIVDAVLNTKYQEIRDKGIVFVFKINDLSSLNISDEDVVVIMSNLLNNAIEACEKCRGDKIIKLKIVIEDNNAIISVKNTYENAVIYENGEIQTTKILDTDEHGIGIKNIAETIRKYGGSYVIQNDEREFYFSIMIPLVVKVISENKSSFFVVFCKISTLSAIDLVKKLCIVILTVEGGVDMIEKMAMGLVDQMAEEKMIDKEAEEYYVYTLVSLMEKFITIGTILLISVLIEKLVPTAFFLLFFLSLRKRTGGYHMNTFFQCYLGTVVTYMLVLGLCMVLVDYPQLVFGLLLVAICIVEVIGTVNHPNIHMDAVELVRIKEGGKNFVCS